MTRGQLTLLPRPSRLQESVAQFILDRRASRCTPATIRHYEYTLGAFTSWLADHGVSDVTGILPAHIRAYLVGLQERGLKDTTQHAHARGIRAWLRWLIAEGELAESPMERVAMPRLEQRVPAPFTPDDVRAMLATCDRTTPQGARDYAIVLTLLDSGLRAAEFCSLTVGSINMINGLITVMGKGHKQRQVRIGAQARKAIRRMMAYRATAAEGEPLWGAYEGRIVLAGALSQRGLASMLKRLGARAGVQPCNPHRFRRTFALQMLRAGCDLHSLRLLMGHSTLAVLQRYLALGGEDVERAHERYSPVDRML